MLDLHMHLHFLCVALLSIQLAAVQIAPVCSSTEEHSLAKCGEDPQHEAVDLWGLASLVAVSVASGYWRQEWNFGLNCLPVKKVSNNLRCKYSQKVIDYATKSDTDALKTSSERII